MPLSYYLLILAGTFVSMLVSWVWYAIFWSHKKRVGSGDIAYDFRPLPSIIRSPLRVALLLEFVKGFLNSLALLLFINYSGIIEFKAVFIIWAGFILPIFITEGLYIKKSWENILMDLALNLFALLAIAAAFTLL